MEKDKFINDVIECFDNKINIIRNIVYNYVFFLRLLNFF